MPKQVVGGRNFKQMIREGRRCGEVDFAGRLKQMRELVMQVREVHSKQGRSSRSEALGSNVPQRLGARKAEKKQKESKVIGAEVGEMRGGITEGIPL